MRAKFHEISWHFSRADGVPKPVFAVDFDPTTREGQWPLGRGCYRCATAGGDNTVKVWKIDCTDERNPKVSFLAELKHQASVNCVRFAPQGGRLAAADDDGVIILWRLARDARQVQQDQEAQAQQQQHQSPFQRSGGSGGGSGGSGRGSASAASAPKGNLQGDDVEDVEEWKYERRITVHRDDIYDLAWSRDGKLLLSGSIDNTACLYNLEAGKVRQQFRDHKQFVQGVAWSPRGNQFITMSSDRTCRVYGLSQRKKTKTAFTPTCTLAHIDTDETRQAKRAAEAGKAGRDEKAQSQAAATATAAPAKQEKKSEPEDKAADDKKRQKRERMFVDETKTLYFRRPAYSPDGSLFVCPAGTQRDSRGQARFVSYLFRSSIPSEPVLRLPAGMPTIAAQFSPQFYAPRQGESGVFKGLEYRMVYAVVSKAAVLVYDTHQAAPLAVVAGTHKAALTDVAWSHDGRVLVVTSEDGYCSSVHFDAKEIGTPIDPPPLLGSSNEKGKPVAAAAAAAAGTARASSLPTAPAPAKARGKDASGNAAASKEGKKHGSGGGSSGGSGVGSPTKVRPGAGQASRGGEEAGVTATSTAHSSPSPASSVTILKPRRKPKKKETAHASSGGGGGGGGGEREGSNNGSTIGHVAHRSKATSHEKTQAAPKAAASTASSASSSSLTSPKKNARRRIIPLDVSNNHPSSSSPSSSSSSSSRPQQQQQQQRTGEDTIPTAHAGGTTASAGSSRGTSQDGFATRHPPVITNTDSQPADIGRRMIAPACKDAVPYEPTPKAKRKAGSVKESAEKGDKQQEVAGKGIDSAQQAPTSTTVTAEKQQKESKADVHQPPVKKKPKRIVPKPL